MKGQCRYITLNKSEQESVSLGYTQGDKHHFRERCHGILLSHQGKTIREIASLFNKRKETVHQWFNRWELLGIEGLKIKAGRGLKSVLSTQTTDIVTSIKKK